MSVNHHSFLTNRTAHFSTYGTLSKKTRTIWFVAHGYGQLASRIIHKFDFLNPEQNYVLAPEGLSRFYWHENNEPVASWMTKLDRYEEIEDFVNYFNALYARTCHHVSRDVKICLFGFSQGCATIWRWIHASQPRFDVVINWAGWIPEDIQYLHLKSYLEGKKNILAYGDQDPFITDKTIDALKDLIAENQMDVDILSFHGGHKIPKDELEKTIGEL